MLVGRDRAGNGGGGGGFAGRSRAARRAASARGGAGASREPARTPPRPHGGHAIPTQDPYLIAAFVILVILSLALHEAAHAGVAYLRGDPTAKDMGRLTLNPIPSIDPVMTILVPAVLLWVDAGFLFGGARPVPVSYHRLRSPARDMMLVALAGPVTNVLIAILLMVVVKALYYLGGMSASSMALQALQHGVIFNLIIAIFNLIPVPPLDGSRVLNWILPESLRPAFMSLERLSLLLVLGLVFLLGEQLSWFIGTVLQPLQTLVDVASGGAWS